MVRYGFCRDAWKLDFSLFNLRRSTTEKGATNDESAGERGVSKWRSMRREHAFLLLLKSTRLQPE